ncbi:MAG TPA: aminodeoxychorismate lyase [Nevskiaceae bacterium]|nr:aminodeoxychorismate lyase [Nevskiaceae bacterium]
MSALYNGKPAESVPLHSRGLNYGDGVFRTLLVTDGRIHDWALQYATLARDAARLSLQLPEEGLLRSECDFLAADRRLAAMKVMLVRAGERRGYAPETSTCERLVSVHDLPRYPSRHWSRGVAVIGSTVQLAQQPLLAGIKHLNRLEQVLASRDWPQDISEALMCDHAGRVAGGTRSNLFWVRQGRLYTPDLSRSGVDGMMKSKVTALARAHSMELRTVDADWAELEQADEIFLTNSLVGIWPVRALEGRMLDAPGVVTARLSALLHHPLPIA